MKIIRRISILLGLALLAASMLILFCWQWDSRASQAQVESTLQTIRQLIPEPQSAVAEERRDNTMSVLSVAGTDFVGILEMPRFNSALPVGAAWGQISKYPCRFNGSIYDGSLQIGASNQKAQYDFYRDISVGDAVYFTDMEGKRYSFSVTDIHYAKHADEAALGKADSALTIFIKNMYAFEYIIIFCGDL